MSYDDIVAAFLTPSDEPIAEPVVPDSPARRLRDVLEPIATIGWWSRSAAEGSAGLGLDFFPAYVWGRAAALGADVDPGVVTAAFGVFEHSVIEPVLAAGRSGASREVILATRAAGAEAGLAAATAGIDQADIEEVGGILLAALANLDTTARPLFTGLRALDVPATAHGRLWRAAELVREHRGDGHLAACVAAGLDPVEMNVLTELWLDYGLGEYSATRGSTPEALDAAVQRLAAQGWVDAEAAGGPAITAAGRAARDEIEVATDRTQADLIVSLGGPAEVDELIARTRPIADAVLASLAAPADPRKRAAG